MMSSEVMALSKSKNSCTNCAELPKNGRVISRSHDVFTFKFIFLYEFLSFETRLHKPSLSWHGKENACLLLWTSGGCQSEGPRGLRPLGPTD
jgi:hypothetical protein